MTDREVIKKLRADGWYEKLPRKGTGHRQFIHPQKPGKVTVPVHKGRDLSMDTLESIERQSGLKLR